jgi:hypothetical protein
MESRLSKAAQGLLDRIIIWHHAGLSPEQIASRIFLNDMEAAAFRTEALVEIVVEYSHQYLEGHIDGRVERVSKLPPPERKRHV